MTDTSHTANPGLETPPPLPPAEPSKTLFDHARDLTGSVVGALTTKQEDISKELTIYTEKAKLIFETNLTGDDLEIAQAEIGRMLTLLPSLVRKNQFDRRPYVDFFFDALAKGGKFLNTAKSIRSELERYAEPASLWHWRDNPLMSALYGLLASVGLVLLAIPWLSQILVPDLPAAIKATVDTGAIKVLVATAIAGTMVSMVNRMPAYNQMLVFDPRFIFLSTFFRTLVAITLAIVVFALMVLGQFSSTILDFPNFDKILEVPGGSLTLKQHSAIIIIGFLSGFSERFASNLLEGAVDKVVARTSTTTVLTKSGDQTQKPV